MNHIITALGALALTTTMAQAGGIDRATLGYGALFEKGRVLTLGFSSVSPSVAGVLTHPLFGPIPTGDMAESYSTVSLTYKADLNEKLAYAFYLNSPFGADAHYTSGAYTGLEAHWNSNQIAALLKYKVTDRASVYGGLRYVTSSATIFVPGQMLRHPITGAVFGPYTASAATDSKLGYVVGAAYEIPDIALRVGLSYESAIRHSFDTAESFAGVFGGATVPGTTEITLPQSIALDFQTGVAKDTLVFGSVRWSEWSVWHVDPSLYRGVVNDEVTGFDSDVITYQLGIGRRINEHLAVFARTTYEPATGDVASRLSPTDGMHSFGIGGSWARDNIKITSGVEYVKLGDAVDASGTVFSGNGAMGFGVNVAFTF